MVFSWCFLRIPRGALPRCHDGSTERLPDSHLPGRTVIQTKAGLNRVAENAEDSAHSTRIESGGMIAWEQVGIQAGLSSLLLAWKSQEILLPPLAEPVIRD